MAVNVREADRDQLWLMPPSVADWLSEDHLAFFILDVVAELDLAEFYAELRDDGRGGAAYDPAMMVAVLIYAYCVGERSSRRIERRLVEVAFRVVAANQCPDHATLARLRARHQQDRRARPVVRGPGFLVSAYREVMVSVDKVPQEEL